jgi:periplasmic protein TonB
LNVQVMRTLQTFSIFREIRYYLWVILGAIILTLALFIVLPLMQTISKPPTDDLLLADVDLANLEPPPPPSPPEQEPESEPEAEEPPPELVEQAAPLDLSQLELALNPDFSEGWMGEGDFTVTLNTIVSTSKDKDSVDAIFSMADLDQKPVVIYQPSPVRSQKLRRKGPAKVNIIFIVDERGRVVEPRIRNSTDPIFEKSALTAVKRWRFEPGKRNGKPVRFRMLVPITFPKG